MIRRRRKGDLHKIPAERFMSRSIAITPGAEGSWSGRGRSTRVREFRRLLMTIGRKFCVCFECGARGNRGIGRSHARHAAAGTGALEHPVMDLKIVKWETKPKETL